MHRKSAAVEKEGQEVARDSAQLLPEVDRPVMRLPQRLRPEAAALVIDERNQQGVLVIEMDIELSLIHI